MGDDRIGERFRAIFLGDELLDGNCPPTISSVSGFLHLPRQAPDDAGGLLGAFLFTFLVALE